MTKSEAITAIVAKVEAFCGLNLDDEARIAAISEHYYDLACAFTGFSVLPEALLPFVSIACVRAWGRRGAEATSHFTGISVSETYVDIESEMKRALSRRQNPLSPVVVKAEEPEAETGSSGTEGGDGNA